MNKGVIVQLEYNIAYILKTDGAFISCPRNPIWQIGDVVTVSRRPLPAKAILVACVVLLFISSGLGAILYNIPSTYIEISVNPSVQITINRFDRVLEVTALNDDGNNVLQGMAYNNLTLYEAYSRVFNRLENTGCLKNATIQLVVSNNSQKAIDSIEQVLRSSSEKYTVANDMRISIMRYTNDEYLSLMHPLPIKEIPDNTDNAEKEPPLSGSYNIPSNDTSMPYEDDEPAPELGMPHHGRWQNGWWDWNCGM